MKGADIKPFVGQLCWVEWADPDCDWHGQEIVAADTYGVTLRAIDYSDPVMGWATVDEGDNYHVARPEEITSIRPLTEEESCQPPPRATSPAVTVGASVRLDAYAVIMRALDEGVSMGLQRWQRKGSVPRGLKPEHVESLRHHLDNELGNALSEVLRFEP